MEAARPRGHGRLPRRRTAGAGAALLLASLTLLGGCVTNGQPPPAVEAQRPVVTAEQLIGLTPPDLARTLGDPAATRKDRPAEIWQYRSASCVLDIFLYEADSGTRVVHLEARGEAAQPLPPQLCLGSLGDTVI